MQNTKCRIEMHKEIMMAKGAMRMRRVACGSLHDRPVVEQPGSTSRAANLVRYLAEMAAIHFCSSFLLIVSEFVLSITKGAILVEVEQHTQHRYKLLLVFLVSLFQELKQNVLEVDIVYVGCFA